jgi:Rps23 Pro-64 3,4-dihydroxylase Tpa1-like proline 4-hydroxylase
MPDFKPFPHFYLEDQLPAGLNKEIYYWLDNCSDWHITKMDFYEQFEFNLLAVNLPVNLNILTSSSMVNHIIDEFRTRLKVKSLELVGIMAHKLTDGQRIAIHNDFINGEETHRLVMHFNPTWTERNGGYLMLFNSTNAEDVSKIIQPLNNSSFGFEISEKSHHAVSRVEDFKRYTIVYTFRQK